MARPRGSTKLTADLQRDICAQLEIAVPAKYAAQSNGIDECTFHDWMKKGEAGETPYAEFFQAVTRAKAKAVANLHVKALEGGRGSQSATWFLERRFRNEYGNIQRIEHAGHDGKAIEITAKAVKDMSDEELQRLADSGTSARGTGVPGTLAP